MAVENCAKLMTVGKDKSVHKCSASITVEASYVMATVILALAVLIRTAYFQCGKTTKIMYLHCIVEQLRFREEERIKVLPYGQAERTPVQVEGYIDAVTWEKQIMAGVHEPEEILRKIAVFEKEEAQRGQKE